MTIGAGLLGDPTSMVDTAMMLLDSQWSGAGKGG